MSNDDDLIDDDTPGQEPAKPPEHAHSRARTLPYGISMCACGAAFGLDGAWHE